MPKYILEVADYRDVSCMDADRLAEVTVNTGVEIDDAEIKQVKDQVVKSLGVEALLSSGGRSQVASIVAGIIIENNRDQVWVAAREANGVMVKRDGWAIPSSTRLGQAILRCTIAT